MTGFKEKKYKIMIVGAIDAGQSNACVIHLFSMAQALAQVGQHVEIVIPKPYGKEIAMSLDNASIVVHQRLSAQRFGLPNSFSSLFFLPWLLFHVKRHQFDIIYSRLNAFSFITCACLRLFTKALIISEHNGWVEDEAHVLNHPKWVAWLEGLFQVWDARLAHLVRVVVPGLRNLLVQSDVPADKIFVVGNGTDTNRLHPLTREAALKKMKLDPTKNYLGFIGNLAAWQGVDLAIKALKKIVSVNPNVILLVAGKGPERHILEKLTDQLNLKRHVIFLGSIPVSQTNLVINAFDIAVAPFTAERNSRIGLSPLKIKDYAAAGRPVIAANVPGIRESTSDDWLTIHEVDREADLCDKILELISSPKRLRQMGEAARKFALAYYDWSQVATRTLEEIENRIK